MSSILSACARAALMEVAKGFFEIGKFEMTNLFGELHCKNAIVETLFGADFFVTE